jgi:hypothetical protein
MEILNSIIEYARKNCPDEIDRAYEFFFEEDNPEDFLSGVALDMSFINFEDWLICDWKAGSGESFIDLYIKAPDGIKDGDEKFLDSVRESRISLYEVKSRRKADVRVEDLLMAESFVIKDGRLSTLKKGDIFGARFFALDGRRIMSNAVYPFSARHKDIVLGYIEKQFARYRKNKNPEGAMRDFLKDEAYILNAIWMDIIQRR